MHGTCYEDLANAIIAQAAHDYKKALIAIKKKPKDRDIKKAIREIERFFRSTWYANLTNLDGEYLIQTIKKECVAYEG